MIVIDTNVVAYLLIQGDRTSVCRRVFAKDPEWCAPFLWRSAFRNVLTMHMRHAEMPVAEAMARMAEAEKLVAGREYSISSATVFELTAKSSSLRRTLRWRKPMENQVARSDALPAPPPPGTRADTEPS